MGYLLSKILPLAVLPLGLSLILLLLDTIGAGIFSQLSPEKRKLLSDAIRHALTLPPDEASTSADSSLRSTPPSPASAFGKRSSTGATAAPPDAYSRCTHSSESCTRTPQRLNKSGAMAQKTSPLS